jgi:hypothetical protein
VFCPPHHCGEITITSNPSRLHWTYYIALEQDMEQVARFVEFSENNYNTYSIELAHLLIAASSEVDVVSKALCSLTSPTLPRENINDYRAALGTSLPDLHAQQVYLPRYGLTLTPWTNWASNTNPDWWRSYNRVKHHRHEHYEEANLKNALNALAGLFLIMFHYYYATISAEEGRHLPLNEVFRRLVPSASLLQLDGEYCAGYLLLE